MELSNKEKSREATFQKRKDTLMKMTRELSILCGLDACIIVNRPGNQELPETWPPFPIRTINKYIDAPRNQKRTLDAAGFYREQQTKMEEKTEKLREKNDSVLDQWLASLSREDLVDVKAWIDEKVELMKARMEFLKAEGTKI